MIVSLNAKMTKPTLIHSYVLLVRWSIRSSFISWSTL